MRLNDCTVIAFGDASFGNLLDGSSQGGFIVFVRNEDGRCAPMLWQSKPLKTVVRSTLAAEVHALADATLAAEYVQNILCEMKVTTKSGVVCITDNKSLYDTLHTTHTLDDRSLRIDVGLLRQKVERKELFVMHVESKKQVADPFTKYGASSVLLRTILSTGRLDYSILV